MKDRIKRLRFAVSLFTTLLLIIVLPLVALASFSDDVDAINDAAQSVLLLEVYNSRNILIATASGFVAFDSNTIITNYHVIDDGANYIVANTDSGDKFEISSVLCANKKLDVAILGVAGRTVQQ